MSIKVAVQHTTKYTYDRPIELGPQIVRLRPAPHTRTPIKGYSLHIEPKEHFINWQQDPFGNYLARLVFPKKVKQFSVAVEVIADMVVINPFDFFVEEYASEFPFKYTAELKEELRPYLEITEDPEVLKEWLEDAKGVIRPEMLTIDFLVALNQKLNQQVNYRIRMEPGIQSCEETLTSNSGSCRDSAWLFVQVLRHFGLAARFASGYLVQLKSDQLALDGPSGPSADFTDLHAWTEVYLPGAGWIGLDPTSGLFAGEGHIPLACTPSPQSAAPISGLAEPAKTEFFFENVIKRIEETPRVTKPYTEAQWQQIIAVGDVVDADLVKYDVRLTMGGEPTFVSIDKPDAEEWNVGADGAHKRKLASELFRRLKDSHGNGPLMQYGQGKWYPGEPLPRWKLACYWRQDGLPIWHDDQLLDDMSSNSEWSVSDADRFMSALVKKLHVVETDVRPAFEDPFYFSWQEQKIPVGVDPLKVDLQSSLERQKLAEVLQHGLGKAVAFVLPLQWNMKKNWWESSTWSFKQDRLFLVPGNSPAGMRLPLESLDFDELEDPFLDEKDRFAKDVSLLSPEELAEDLDRTGSPHQTSKVIKTALVLEVRKGKLFVFMPPVVRADHYLRLISAVEQIAKTLEMPLLIEGYDPPSDNLLQKFMVTPDPGVIEVNINPADSWRRLLTMYEDLFEKATISRLTTEKFNLDGKHTGTGGGNHITLGGSKPENSPMLRRPDLLRSLVTYWQHHPSLSYLFSTQYIGPTSQAPRVDEGRDEMLYELELAFDQIPDDLQEDQVPYWLVDRIFRNLLIDVTGNTHRAEFCIDKLYSPDSSSGRLGILEFRGFDMPPHYRMCMVQFLLIRSLVARFWKQPYTKKLVRWGTSLHDRFLLPHYCHQDLAEVVGELKEAGYAFELDWFDPFFSFRFPFLGELRVDDIHLELSMAIEPWHVLAEELSSSGTARFVDSSMERLQVKIAGLTDERYRLLCNGFSIPLQKTRIQGTYVAGVRYRAWQPPSALHPTLTVDTPLTFDLYDTWSEKSIAGCQYHVSHPGGRSYDTAPVNSYEAESRRIARYFDFGHTTDFVIPTKFDNSVGGRFVTEVEVPSIIKPKVVLSNQEYPYTMDLRRYKSIKA